MKPVTSKCWALSNIYIRLVICIGNRWFVILKSELNLQNFRDIKPSNFSVGLGEKANNIYLYDFGLSRQYKGKIWNVAHIIWGLSIWLSWMVDIIGMCKIDVDDPWLLAANKFSAMLSQHTPLIFLSLQIAGSEWRNKRTSSDCEFSRNHDICGCECA